MVEGNANYLETHTAADAIREYESKTGCAATEFLIAFANAAHNLSPEAVAKIKAKREAMA